MENNTKQHFEETLMACMTETPFRRISVAELCRSAQLSRNAFYYHYSSVDDCFESLIQRVMYSNSVHIMENVEDYSNLEQLYTVQLEFWQTQKMFLNCISQNGMFSYFLNHYLQYNLQEEKNALVILNTPGLSYDADILNFYIGGTLSFIMQWAQRDFDTPIPEMVRKLIRLVHEPLIQNL